MSNIFESPDFMKWFDGILKKQNECPDVTNESSQDVPDLVTSSSGKTTLEGLLVFYVNVGQMPPANVEKYLERMRESYKAALSRIPDNYAVIFVPRRESQTTIELVRF